MSGSTFGTLFRVSTFGESHEQLLRAACAAAGDPEGAADFSAEVRWRDSQARAFAATVDGLGKLAQTLGVPAQALWRRVPDVTDQELDDWQRVAAEQDTMGTLVATLAAQDQAATDAAL